MITTVITVRFILRVVYLSVCDVGVVWLCIQTDRVDTG